MNILVAEDSIVARWLITSSLREFGHTVYETANGPQALELINKVNFDAAIVDALMPLSMDGFELITAIRNSNTSNKLIPVVILTATPASNLQELKDKVSNLGPIEVVQKPQPIGTIIEILKSLSPK